MEKSLLFLKIIIFELSFSRTKKGSIESMLFEVKNRPH